jgi:hypothetical protein
VNSAHPDLAELIEHSIVGRHCRHLLMFWRFYLYDGESQEQALPKVLVE